MITIVTIDEAVLDKAARVAGIRDKTALVRRSLESLIAGESAKRLAALAGSEAGMANVPRRRVEVEAEDSRDGITGTVQFPAGRERTVTEIESVAAGGGNGR